MKAYVRKRRRARQIKAACKRLETDQLYCRVKYVTPKNKRRSTEVVVYRTGRTTYEYF